MIIDQLKNVAQIEKEKIDSAMNVYIDILSEKEDPVSTLTKQLSDQTVNDKNIMSTIRKTFEKEYGIDLHDEINKQIKQFIKQKDATCEMKNSAGIEGPFKIVSESRTIIQFNFRSKVYSHSPALSSIEFIEKQNEQLKDEKQKQITERQFIERVKKRPLYECLKDNNKFIKNPVKYVWLQISMIAVYPFKRKKMIKTSQELINMKKRVEHQIEKDIERNLKEIHDQQMLRPIIDAKFAFWAEYLASIGYRKVSPNSHEIY